MHDVKGPDEISDWTRSYEKALRGHLRKGASADMKSAARLGRSAVILGLETLDIANVHERFLRPHGSSAPSKSLTEELEVRARYFFLETLVPIERTHRAALDADVRVKDLTQALLLRKRETIAAKRTMERCITRRESAEAAFREIDQQRTQLLKESKKLQHLLRTRLRKLIEQQEDGRQAQSLHLCNVIGQSLLALDLGLISLKSAGIAGMRKLSKEIGETERLVRQSAKTLTRMSHDSKKT
jgi:hypothetical protein